MPFSALAGRLVAGEMVRCGGPIMSAVAGTFAGIHAPTAERARDFREFGCRFIALGGDQTYLAAGAGEALRAARES